MKKSVVAAIDLGAESGRVAAVSFDGEKLSLEVAHRFANAPRSVDGVLRWDYRGLSKEILHGLALVGACHAEVGSVGADTWGLDYGLFNDQGTIIDDPSCYRDPRNVVQFGRALRQVGADRMYTATGIQLNEINSVYALMDDAKNHPERLRSAAKMLMMPDVFHHLLSGSDVTEFTIASTSALFDMSANQWATSLMDELGIPTHMLPEVAMAGTDVGQLQAQFRTGGLSRTRVILPPGHDTASAVVAVPFEGADEAFISSGTWSLVGVICGRPMITAATQRANLTNEGGYQGDIRLLNNVMGLWLLQCCRRQWASEGHDVDYGTLAEAAGREPGLVSIINPNAVDFLAPGDTPQRIRDYCRRNGITVPESMGAMARCIVDSLALSYRHSLTEIAAATGRRLTAVNVVGGGVNNSLLQQATADATGLPVRCGAVEATALGNAGTQFVALGEMTGVEDIRTVIKRSFGRRVYEPQSDPRWDEAAAVFDKLVRIDLGRRGLNAD
jgi:rhamnulokinase